MTNLRQRGFLHCTTLWLLITSILFTYSYVFKKVNVYLLTFMLIIAYSSHHIRDANRRGIWLYPFGHTAAVHKYMYVFLICALPYLYALCYEIFLSDFVKHVIGFDYKIIVQKFVSMLMRNGNMYRNINRLQLRHNRQIQKKK